MWDDLSKISIALHKSGVPPRPRLNWTLGCLEILEQKRGTLITVVTPFHIVRQLTCAKLLTGLELPFLLLRMEKTQLRELHLRRVDIHSKSRIPWILESAADFEFEESADFVAFRMYAS